MPRRMNLVNSNKMHRPNQSLTQALQDYVLSNPGLDAASYGEIEFKDYGSRSTYSPYISCQPSTDPEIVWNLFFEHWLLNLPNMVICIAGELTKRESAWNNVMGETWIITTGCSPAHTIDSACTIGVVASESVKNFDAAFSANHQNGLFPATFTAKKSAKSKGKLLDHTHTHFIFVKGNETDAANFRSEILNFIGSVPTEMDASFTKFVTIPVLVMLVSDDENALLHICRSALAEHPVVIDKSATKVTKLLQWSNSQSKSEDVVMIERMRFIQCQEVTSCISDPTEIEMISRCLRRWLANESSYTLYPSAKLTNLHSAFLSSVVKSKKFAFRSQIRLALSWDRMDFIRILLTTREHLKEDAEYISLYLVMALSLNRSSFIEYLDEIGINAAASLTVNTLWSLYFRALFKDEYATETTVALRRVLSSDGANGKLLAGIGRIISDLTKHEVSGLYTDPIYEYHGAERHAGRRSTVFSNYDDDSPTVPYPERDLFLYCILMGKKNLAQLFWKTGSNLIFSSLVASSITQALAADIENVLDNDLAEKMYDDSRFWAEKAGDFLDMCFKKQKAASLCQLTQKVEIYGGCSAMNLAHTCKHLEFLSHSASQISLDYIWHGATKQDESTYKTVLGMCCPFIVPMLGIIERENAKMEPDLSKNNRSTFMYTEKINKQSARFDTGLIGVLSIIEDGSYNETGVYVRKNSLRNRLVYYLRDIYDFLNSPRIKFYNNSLFLLVAVGLLSFNLLATDMYPITNSESEQIVSIILFLYMIGLLFDEIRQMVLTDKSDTSFGVKLRIWFSSTWNKMDLIMLLCYLFAQSIMWSGEYNSTLWYTGKCFMCIAALCLYLRCFQMFLVFKYFGPKVYMMRRMLKDLIVFLAIMAVVFFSYGTILTALTNEPGPPQANGTVSDVGSRHGQMHKKIVLSVKSFRDFVFVIYNHIIRIPYWQLYDNALNNADRAQTEWPALIRSIVTGFYMLFSNILMLNLLIAMFSYTFQNIQDHANIFWCFHRFDVIEEFCDRPWIPSPFVIVEDIVRGIQWIKGGSGPDSPFKTEYSDELTRMLKEFEHDVIEEKESHETEDTEVNTTLVKMRKSQIKMEHQLLEIKSEMAKVIKDASAHSISKTN